MRKYRLFKFFVLFIAFSCLYSLVNAQQLPGVEKKIIRDSLDNLIINGDIPVFLHISDNPEGENSVKLQPGEPDSTPLTFEKPGKHSFTHFDSHLNENIHFYFIVDNTPPTTNYNCDIPLNLKEDTVFGGENFKIYLVSNDKYSGVERIYYSLNQEDYKIYDSPFELTKEGYYEVKFFAVDKAGNIEKPKLINAIVDLTHPVTNLTIEGDQHDNVISARSTIQLNAGDNASGVKNSYYAINENEFNKYTGKITVDHLQEGYHTIKYYSTDNAGNSEPGKSFEVFVDKTPPIIIEEITGNRFLADGKEYTSGRSQLRITAIDNKAGVKEIYYSINDQEYQLYERPVFLSGHDGEINISTYAIDNVNNKGEGYLYHSEKNNVPYVDLNPPILQHKIAGKKIHLRDTLFISARSKINLDATDRESGLNRIIYKINNNEEQLYTTPFSVKGPGFYNIEYRAFDNVENSNYDTFSVYVDDESPQIKYDFSINSYNTITKNGKHYEIYPPQVKLYLSATDIRTGTKEIYYKLNGSEEHVYSRPIGSFEKDAINHVTIRAIDMLGNISTENISFYISE